MFYKQQTNQQLIEVGAILHENEIETYAAAEG